VRGGNIPKMSYRYDIQPDEYEHLTLVDDAGWSVLQGFTGESRAASWRPLRVEAIPSGPRGDFPLLASHVPVFSRRALDVLGDLVAGDAEALPLDFPETEYYALNVLDPLDCIDEERSEIERFSDGTVMFVSRYVFFRGCTQGRALFKVRSTELQDVFVSDDFRRRVEEHGLRGLRFVPIDE
jgi:hypothetical protein